MGLVGQILVTFARLFKYKQFILHKQIMRVHRAPYLQTKMGVFTHFHFANQMGKNGIALLS